MNAIKGGALVMAMVVLASTAGHATPPANPSPTPAPAIPAMLPDRMLECDLGRALNLDPTRNQQRSEVHYEGHHPFRLFLPGIAKRTAPPPDPADPAEPVDPRTKVAYDPDRLTDGVPAHFDRVVDYWPSRVEMATTMPDGQFHFIVISDIDLANRTAILFMTQATDVANMDLKHVYSGQCRIAYHTT